MKIKVTKSMLKARNLLMVLLLFIAKGESHWYTLNGSHKHHSYSLARRLGFFGDDDYYAFLVAAGLAGYKPHTSTGNKQIYILKKEWESMVGNQPDLFKVETKRFDLHGALIGKQKQYRKYDYHTIRIGVFKRNANNKIVSHPNLSSQVCDKKKPVAPDLPGLTSMQRSFCRNVRRMACDVMTEDDDFYDAIKLQTKESDKLHEDDADADKKRKREEEEEEEEEEEDETPLQYRDKNGKFGRKEAARLIQSLSRDELDLLLTEAVATNTSDDGVLHLRNQRNGKDKSYVRVPTNETDASFIKYSAWLDSAININAGKTGDKVTSAKRIMKRLHQKFKNASLDALKELKFVPPGKMNEIQVAAMYKAANISNRHHRRALMRQLRHHFGNVFAPEYKVEMLCEGHTKVYTGSYTIPNKTKEGALTEIKFSRKNIADELAAQLTRQLNYRGIDDPSHIKRIDVMAGGDHGQGAFIFGAKVVVILKGLDGGEDELFTFEITTAEIKCDKDTAEILNHTIRKPLVEELRKIYTQNLSVGLDKGEDGKLRIVCSYDDICRDMPNIQIKVELYIVGDLAFFALLQGMDGMSPHHCLICEMKGGADMNDLNGSAKQRSYADMKRLGEDHQKKMNDFRASSKKSEPKAELGCKDVPWFDFLPSDRFIVPLLHCLIGIGDAILTKFRGEVAEKIEYLTPDEINMRSQLSQLEVIQAELREKRNAWDEGVEGKELKSLQGKRKRANACLRKLSPLAIAKAAAPKSFLEELMEFIEVGGDEDDDDMEGDADLAEEDESESNAASDAAASSSTATVSESATETNSSDATNNAVTDKIAGIKRKLKELDGQIKPLEAARKKMTNRLEKNNTFIKKTKDLIKGYKSDRKLDGDGVETRLFSILKDFYGIKLQAYHGGSLHGKDHQKVMNNSHEMFTYFADVLKEEKKKNAACTLTDEDIDELCSKYANLYLLWDGAFSYASTINPTGDDIVMYEKFVTAAVHSHIELGMKVTPNVHLMWKHVKHQMKFPGGLGHKREDWVEHLHQITRKLRDQFRTTQDDQIRANAKARREQQYSNPEVEAYVIMVEEEAAYGPRKDYVKKEEERKKNRMLARKLALDKWEAGHPNERWKEGQ